jgi:multicomponent Na+:H+ antiporter subunit F
MTGTEFLDLAVTATFVMLALALVLGFVRMVKGPTLPDRVVALDMLTVLIVAFCAVYAVSTDETDFLDVALVLALVGFLATVALARFAERRVLRSENAGEADAGEELRDD